MEFWKMNGAGNDFIVVDNRTLNLTQKELSHKAVELCQRKFSIGADGLMVVNCPTMGGDFSMLFFNSDGSIGEMCGNGARCICRYAWENGLSGEIQRVETTAGLITGYRLSKDQYRIQLNIPTVLDQERMTDLGKTGYAELGCPGIPHGMLRISDLADKPLDDLRPIGKALRWDPAFPRGANANLYDILGPDHLIIRTYERGVEDFTYACGTGTGALVALLTKMGVVSGNNVKVENLGGTLQSDAVMEDGIITKLYLTGPAIHVYTGLLAD